MTESLNQIRPSSNSIIYKTKFGKLVKVENLKPEKYLTACSDNLDVDEIPSVTINNQKPLTNKGLYLTMSPREKTFLYSAKDLDVPLCYLTKKNKKRYNNLKKTKKNKIHNDLVKQLPYIEQKEKEEQDIKNEKRKLELLRLKEAKDEKKRLKLEENLRKKRILQNLKNRNKKKTKGEEKEQLINYYNILEKLSELIEKMKMSDIYQKKELKFKLVKTYIKYYNTDKQDGNSEKYLKLLDLKNKIDINRYLIKLQKLSTEIYNLLPYIYKEIISSDFKEDYFKELNIQYIEIIYTFKSNLYFFNRTISSEDFNLFKDYNKSRSIRYTNSLFSRATYNKTSSEKIGFFIESYVINPLKNNLVNIRRTFNTVEDKDYIDNEIKKYTIVIQLLDVQKQMLVFNEKINKKFNNISFLNLGKINNNELETDIKNYKTQLRQLKTLKSTILTKEKKEEAKNIADELNDEQKKLLVLDKKKQNLSKNSFSTDFFRF